VAAAGCASLFRDSVQDRRMPRYQPDTERRGEWVQALQSSTAPEGVAPDANRAPSVPSNPPPSLLSRWFPARPAPAPAPAPAAVAPEASTNAVSGLRLRTMNRGDRVSIRLECADPQQFEEVVDDNGFIRLLHIGAVQAAGKTTTEIEDLLERKYIEGQIYKFVNVIVVSMDDEFFVRGEVKREGRFPLTGAITLSKAIPVAGGYTEYADKRKATIQRGDQILAFDMEKIYKGEEKDPLLKRGDSVWVPRRWY
jgi:polysaccharide export outer membrane protein